MNRTRAGAGVDAHADAVTPFSGSTLDRYRLGSYPGHLRGIARHRPLGGAAKRSMDVVIALMALALLAPTVLVIAALRTRAGRAIFDSEDYVGFNGRAFTSYTFGILPDEHASYRVRACLRILRDSRLDRLPLLFSVLRGDMSLVGPRPLRVRDLDRPGRRAQVYFAARPGLISLRHAGHGRLAIDRYYVRRWSIWLDLVVLANAIMAVRRD